MLLFKRFAIIFILTILAFFMVVPNFYEKWQIFGANSVKLGLDLKGGSHLLLEADIQSYTRELLENLADAIKQTLKTNKLRYKNFHISQDNIVFYLPSVNKTEKEIRALIRDVDKNTVIESDNDKFFVKFSQEKLTDIDMRVMNQLIEILRMRVDPTGTKEPSIQRQGENKILLQVPGEEDPEALKSVIGTTAKLSFHLVNTDLVGAENDKEKEVPRGYKYLLDDNGYLYLIKEKPELTGDMLVDSYVSFNEYRQPVVGIEFNEIGTKIFANITKSNVDKLLAVVLDNKVLSAPRINQSIIGGKATISGNFTTDSANELALLLKSGALIAPLSIVEEKTVGPTLGSDSIEAGKKAGMISFIAVGLSMVLVYGVLGVFANIALALTMLYIFAMLTMLNAVLTLPGIAGLILTIGMAVDANVLIYERIREEIYKNRNSLYYSIKQGFASAFRTIADSNITTLIAGVILYIFGTGTIKGFAVTLSIGVIASMFSAIVITKFLIDTYMKFCSPNKLI